MRPFIRRFIACVALCLLLVACRQTQINSADLRMTLTASDHLVGDATLLLSVTDASGKAIAEPGSLTLRADMDHAGMVPVIAEAERAVNGVFSVPFTWTMGGGWIVEATLTLPNGDIARQTYNLEILSEATMDDAAAMDHGEMDAAAMSGESSAVYLRIENRGADDITITAASSDAASHVEFHETVVVDDIARMEALGGLRVPAGETIELRPGGAHIMLMGLQRDLTPDSQLTLRLSCDKGETYHLDVSIMNMRMGRVGRRRRHRRSSLQQPLGAPRPRRLDQHGRRSPALPLMLHVHTATPSQAAKLQAAFDTHMGWTKPAGYFQDLIDRQAGGDLELLVARENEQYAGHCKVVWRSAYPGFAERDIPEIQDLNVRPDSDAAA